MSGLEAVLRAADGVPGAVGMVARGDDVEVAVVGSVDAEGSAPMRRDSIFRFASITKPITAAAVLLLVQDGLLGFDDPVQKWLPELADRTVVRTPSSPVDDVVPATRPITVEDLLTSRCGYGFPSDFTLPQVTAMCGGQPDGRHVQHPPAPDQWLAELARVPLLYQPGAAYLYNTSSDLQGVLVARAGGRSLPDFLTERILAPLGMVDTAFTAPRGRLTSAYHGDGTLFDAPDGQWSTMPAFPSGAGGLAGTADDWLRFARMLLGQGPELLTPESIRRMTTDHLTPAQRDAAALFLEGQGWGYGGSVDVDRRDPWTVPGRYGWVGGTGTSAHVVPSRGAAAILLTTRSLDNPAPPDHMRTFWTYAATA